MNEFEEMQQDETEADEWDDVDLSDILGGGDETTESNDDGQQQPEADQEADQQTGEAEGTDTDGAEGQTATQTQADQPFVLKHLDETREVNRDEVIQLAQKGMDYDRIREGYDAYKDLGDAATLREYKEFLEEMANGRPVSEMMDAIRASALVEQGMDKDLAAERVKLDRERKAFEREKSKAQAEKAEAEKAQTAADEHKKWEQDCIADFAKQFPNVQPKDVPQEVWNAFSKGETLVSAYRGYRMAELEKQLAAKTQADDNASRAVGSRLTTGKTEKQDDPLFDGWDDDY